MTHRLSLTLLLPALLLLSSCKPFTAPEIRHIKAPTAQVLGAKMDGASDEAVRILILVDLVNPNDVPLPVTEARYEINVAGVGSASAKDRPHVTLPALGRHRVELPVALRTRGKDAGELDRYQVRGDISYDPPGEIRAILTESKVPRPKVSFRGEGVLY